MDDQDVDELVALADERLRDADAALAGDYPGDRGAWQPVHTVYVPADRFSEHTHREYGDVALGLLERNEELFREVTGVDVPTLALVRDKLQSRPVEDLRVDFEDGYGVRTDADEDADARAACEALTRLRAAADSPGRTGIRFKSLEAPTRRRGLRTLTIVLDGMPDLYGDDFVLTLPKVTSVEQVETLVAVLEQVEAKLVQGVGGAAVRDPGRDAADHPRPRRQRAGRADDPRCRPTADRPALRHLRLLRVPRHRRGGPEPGAPRRRPCQGRRCRRPRPAPESPSPTARPTSCRSATSCGRAGSCTTASSPAPCTAASTRAGTCTPPSSRPGSPRPSSSSGRVRPRRRPDSTAYDEGREGAVADEPATVRALADFLVRGLECGALISEIEVDRRSSASWPVGSLSRPACSPSAPALRELVQRRNPSPMPRPARAS